MSIKEAKKREHFFCQSCTAENGKTAENSHEATAQSDEKVNYFLILALSPMPCFV
jgi:protein-arginine kinase activator protein McsA